MLFAEYPEVTERSIIMNVRKNLVVAEEYRSDFKNYKNPVVPDGYRHIVGTDWKTGFMVERKKDGSKFTFVPVGYLKPNGTLKDMQFNEKFGRRKWYPDDPEELGEEPITGIENLLWLQNQSIREHGVFYISRYTISVSEFLKPSSGVYSRYCTMINFNRAKYIAESFENTPQISSHLLFGAEYDSMLEWLVETEAICLEDITKPNYDDNSTVNNIYGLSDIGIWTQERDTNGNSFKVGVRGAIENVAGTKNALAWRQAFNKYMKRPDIGFRIALYIS